MGERRDSPTVTRAADGLGDVPTAPFPPVADDGPVLPGVNAQIPPAQHVRVFGSRAIEKIIALWPCSLDSLSLSGEAIADPFR